ncbi:MAG: tetratricopeptide repeat protein, partial [Anaerolineales bacterium]|nr:tetratricopeptide repeat protein [Anaerolineales bacterium]
PLSEIRYLFRHALLRDAAYQMQLQTRLRALHQLAAQTLEQLFIEEKRPYLSDLVFHFRQAGMDDKERYYARLLGDEAADQYANGDAISAYSRALELAHDDPVEQAKMLLARAKIYKLVGNREAQEADMAQLMTLLTAVDDSQLQHDIWLEQASFAELRGDYHQAAKIANQLLETVPIRQYPRTVTLAHHQLGRSLIDIAEHEKAKKVLFETLTLAQRYGFQSEEASALLHLGHAFDDQKLFHDAIRYYEQALPIFADLNDKRGQCVLYNNLGVAAAVVADMATTLRYYEQALTIANEIGFRRGQLVIAGNVANQKARQGKYGEALANMLQSVTLSRELGSPRDESRFLNNIGYLYVELGLYDESLSYFQQSLDIRQRIGVRRSVGSSLLNLALWALRQERYEEARQYAQRGFEVSHEIEDKNGEVQATMFLGRALAGLGRLTEAETTFQTTLAGAHDLNQTEGGAMIEALCGLADLFWARGERSVALAHVAQILEMLAKHVPEDLINPRRIRWHCYQMLRVVDAEAAAELLDALVMELQQFAEQIPDTVMRHSFLTNVLMNRAILEEARSVISSRR